MTGPTATEYEARDYLEAAKVAAQLAKTGYDLSESERNSLRHAATVLQSWATSLPRK